MEEINLSPVDEAAASDTRGKEAFRLDERGHCRRGRRPDIVVSRRRLYSVLPRCLIQMKDDPGHELSDADAGFPSYDTLPWMPVHSDKDETVKIFIYPT